MNWYLKCLKQYADFSGRARRKEYWIFALFNFIIVLVLGFIESATGIKTPGNPSILAPIYQLAILIPSIAVGVRRMHDVGKSGWFILIPIYNLILALTEGQKGENKYGTDIKQDRISM